MITLYLCCFIVGLFSGVGHMHVGHFHLGHAHVHVKTGGTHLSAFNGFTLAAFLCWFGGAGYLLEVYSSLIGLLVITAAIACGFAGAAILYVFLFKFLLPRERVLSADDTRMEGTLARVSDEVRALDGIGEILFTQTGVRRAAPARSEDGIHIPRGTEVVVLRYERGIAYVRPLHELSTL
jgi:membrane protein implicated in regulation of membrane protease activity